MFIYLSGLVKCQSHTQEYFPYKLEISLMGVLKTTVSKVNFCPLANKKYLSGQLFSSFFFSSLMILLTFIKLTIHLSVNVILRF